MKNFLSRWELTPFRFALIYLLFGLGLLYFSDVVLVAIVDDPLLAQLQWIKGFLEVLITALLIYVITRFTWQKLLRKERVIEEASVGVSICEPGKQCRISYVNKQFESMTGYSKRSIQGQPLDVLWDEGATGEKTERLREALNRGEQCLVELGCRRKDGGMFINRIEVFPIYNNQRVEQYVVFHRDVTEREKTREQLRERERRFRQVAENIQEVFYLVTADYSTVLYLNEAYEEIWGRSVDEVYEDPWSFTEAIVEEDRREVLDRKQNFITESAEDELVTKYRIRRPDGELRWIRDRMVPIRDSEGAVTRFAGTALDITEEQQLQNKLSRSLEESRTLLREVHHRVKNNMQILLSLIGLQARDVHDEAAQAVLDETRQRILSMSLIHQQLYQSGTISEVDFSTYVSELIDRILDIQLHPDREVSVTTRIETPGLELDAIIPCGLILNELITNSLEHGLSDDELGEILVEFYQRDSRYHLVVEDNGSGAGKDQLVESSSLGMRLVRNLVENQLSGELNITDEDGLRVEVVFPLDPAGVDSIEDLQADSWERTDRPDERP